MAMATCYYLDAESYSQFKQAAVRQFQRMSGTGPDYEDDFDSGSSSDSSSELTQISSASLSTNTFCLRLNCDGYPLIRLQQDFWDEDLASQQSYNAGTKHSVSHPIQVVRPKRRTNMSFSNEEMRKIVRENEILLSKIMAQSHSTRRHDGGQPKLKRPSAYVNRMKQHQKINRENHILLHKIQNAKTTV